MKGSKSSRPHLIRCLTRNKFLINAVNHFEKIGSRLFPDILRKTWGILRVVGCIGYGVLNQKFSVSTQWIILGKLTFRREEMRSEATRRNLARRDDTRWVETNQDNRRRDAARSEETRQDEMKRDERPSNATRQEEIRQNKRRREEARRWDEKQCSATRNKRTQDKRRRVVKPRKENSWRAE